MNWIQASFTVLSAVSGGFVGGWVAAFRMGRWQQRVEDRLERTESRLLSGDRTLSSVPVIGTRLDLMLEEIRSLRADLKEQRRQFVSHGECDRRHGLPRAH